ncbi:MAG: hypothetical protein ASARMPRED_007126 [Alectoria sarmentosa]|nr:MAG: hypothetical protein ASARMPRED_007126 [Alectoria sarmentosa]
MDPLSAFGLACGVIQVLDFSRKVVVKCRELYKHGASSENEEIESMAKCLTGLSTDLVLANSVRNSGRTTQLYHDDQELLKLAQQCSRTATELVAKLQKLSIQDRFRKRDAVRKAVNGVWKKSTIEGIERRLEQYRRTLDTRILISLRQHVHLISNEQSNGFGDLDRKLQNLIIGVDRNHNTFNELKGLSQAENALSQQHVTQEFVKYHQRIAAEDFHKRLLESLYFPDIHARQEGIVEAHKQTFEWIFDKPCSEVRPWYHFIEWLQTGRGTYWISGKAGSGKSTLMNFICQDPRTEAALRVWSGTSEIFMPKFFFWSPGTQLQKSLAGLLRSLIYQLLGRFPDSMPMLTRHMSHIQHRLQQLPTWTEQRLGATLRHLLSDGLDALHLCIFIDGLDEFHGNRDTLLDLVRHFRTTTRVKFCLSSRPLPSFKNELGSSAMLELQDLTGPDIRRFLSDKLDRAPLKASQAPYSSSRLKDTVDTIIHKAEGVFLWVDLAVRDQIEGIRNGDDVGQLRERLQLLPEEMERIYSHMLQGIDKVYRKEATQYLQLVIHFRGLSLFDIALAVHEWIFDGLLFSPDTSISDIRHHCKLIGERIYTTCKGFLEVREYIDRHEWQKTVTRRPNGNFLKPLEDRSLSLEQSDDLIQTKFYQTCTHVTFLHQTAFDFFEDNEKAKEFLEASHSANLHPQVLYVKALLAGLVVFPVSTEDIQVQISIGRIMDNASIAENETGVAQLGLMDLLDRSIKLLCQRSPGQPSKLHWCRAWGYPEVFNSLDSERTWPLSRSQSSPASVPRDDGTSATGPIDFLGFAAWCGIYKYVGLTLDAQSRPRNHGAAGYLLSCAVGGLDRLSIDWSWHLKLISALLKRGADPNTEALERTVWGSFLQKLHNACYGRSLEQDPSIDTGWRKTVRAFLDSGANVNERICYNLGQDIFEDVNHLASSTSLKLTRYLIRLDLSALSVLQQCFGDSPKISEIEDACISSGAALYSECTEMLFEIRDEVGQRRWLDSKLTKQQLSQLISIWEERLKALTGDRKKQRQILKGQAVELFQELDIGQLLEQARREEELQEKQVREEESQENQSGNEKSTSDRPSIDAPDSNTLEGKGPPHSARSSQIGG